MDNFDQLKCYPIFLVVTALVLNPFLHFMHTRDPSGELKIIVDDNSRRLLYAEIKNLAQIRNAMHVRVCTFARCRFGVKQHCFGFIAGQSGDDDFHWFPHGTKSFLSLSVVNERLPLLTFFCMQEVSEFPAALRATAPAPLFFVQMKAIGFGGRGDFQENFRTTEDFVARIYNLRADRFTSHRRNAEPFLHPSRQKRRCPRSPAIGLPPESAPRAARGLGFL